MISPIYAWGIELEAGYGLCNTCKKYQHMHCYHPLEGISDKLFHKWYRGEDGSLVAMKKYVTLFELKPEIPIQNRKELEHDVELIYSRIEDVNYTMGMHIHVSFNDLKTYATLASWEFVDLFQRVATMLFPELTNRLRGFNNPYARGLFDRKSFMLHFMECRPAVNLISFVSRGTYEFRLFGMNPDKDRALEYISFLEDIIMDFMELVEMRIIIPESVFSLMEKRLVACGYTISSMLPWLK